MPALAANSPLTFPVAGVDEVGRGPLAGPVVAAAVVLDPARPIVGLNDSKCLGESTRERLDTDIRRNAALWCIAQASVAEIDELNILHASLLAMQRAVQGVMCQRAGHTIGNTSGMDGQLELFASESDARSKGEQAYPDGCLALGGRRSADHARPQLVLVDGNRSPGFAVPSAAIVKGDGRVQCIGAASIIAKVWRDRYMASQEAHYPGYGFASHKGYGTAVHKRALAELGVTALHRLTFAPVKLALQRHEGVVA